MHERAGDGRHHPRPAAGHEDVGDVDVEGGHDAVQEGEPELAHVAPVVDAGQAVHELVDRHGQEEEQLHAEHGRAALPTEARYHGRRASRQKSAPATTARRCPARPTQATTAPRA